MDNFGKDYDKQAAFVNDLFERLKSDESWEPDPAERERLSDLLRFNIERCAQ